MQAGAALPGVPSVDSATAFAACAKAAWARLIRKVYEADPLECPNCKGPMRVIALIEDPQVIRRILEHLGLWARLRIALGPRAGQKVLSLRTVPSRDEKYTPVLCAEAHGFSLHAGVRCGAHQRKELERLCRYITRPAIANERLKRNREGQVVLQLKSAYRDGTTYIVMSPLEFMQRLAALVLRPRLHLMMSNIARMVAAT